MGGSTVVTPGVSTTTGAVGDVLPVPPIVSVTVSMTVSVTAPHVGTAGVPGVGVAVGGISTVVVVSLPDGISGPPGMLGVDIVVGGTSMVTVVSLP